VLEYRKAALDRALRAKGYSRFTVAYFRVLGQVSWQVEFHDRAGGVIRRLGGPAARHREVQAQIEALPRAVPPPPSPD
jgi:hypothetical protein